VSIGAYVQVTEEKPESLEVVANKNITLKEFVPLMKSSNLQ
jgi:hypothetical protein